MNNKIQTFVVLTAVAVSLLVGMGAGIALRDNTVTECVATPEHILQRLEHSYISGPLVAELGELCVFTLSDPNLRADWIVVRQIDRDSPTTFYIDSAGSALSFSSNIAAKYTIVAAVVEEGKPRILQHVFQYALSPEPSPPPEPKPRPAPTPNPEPLPVTLTDWVRENIPEVGEAQAAALASCYESAASAIEKGSIKTPEAAFSAIRTSTQTKIKIEVWKNFLDKLSEKVGERYASNRDMKELAAIFKEIAEGLRVPSSPQGGQS